MKCKDLKNFFVVSLIPVLIFTFTSCSNIPNETGNTAAVYSERETETSASVKTACDAYTYVSIDNVRLSYGNLILVNRDASFTRSIGDEKISALEYKNDCYLLRENDITMSKTCIEALNTWTEAFAEATGLKNIVINSGYRSVEYQKQLIEEMNEEYGEAYTSLVAAVPSYSEHHTGLGIDLCVYENNEYVAYSANGKYAWFLENAKYFGFVQRYKSSKADITHTVNEDWHFRYVGIPHAEIMEEHDFCLEEYIDYLRQFKFDDNRLYFQSENGSSYEIYFVNIQSGDETYIPVPVGHEYEISGNNVDGFIVTVTL